MYMDFIDICTSNSTVFLIHCCSSTQTKFDRFAFAAAASAWQNRALEAVSTNTIAVLSNDLAHDWLSIGMFVYVLNQFGSA